MTHKEVYGCGACAESGPGPGSDMSLGQILFLIWLWPRLWFCCGCGLDSCSDVALVCS